MGTVKGSIRCEFFQSMDNVVQCLNRRDDVFAYKAKVNLAHYRDSANGQQHVFIQGSAETLLPIYDVNAQLYGKLLNHNYNPGLTQHALKIDFSFRSIRKRALLLKKPTHWFTLSKKKTPL